MHEYQPYPLSDERSAGSPSPDRLPLHGRVCYKNKQFQDRVPHLFGHSDRAHLSLEVGKLRLPEDDERPLPRGKLIPYAKYTLTFGTDIEAPPPLV